MSGIGHNGGPSMERGAGFRKVAWTKARTALMPALPLEVVRLRVKRAQRLGLPYKTYATIRAVSGRDIVGFLFSDNALGMRRDGVLPVDARTRLDDLDSAARRLAALHPPLDPERVLAGGGFEATGRAPGLFTPWREAREGLRDLARRGDVPFDGLIVVAATTLERDWSANAGFGGTVARDVMFPGAPAS
ncbi:hypothetical protein [Hasllibacter sp. MH4015]|uniref:hypothetical protein n=1 Tax=Hasllibacter sp. MH4015 TaxID=2854029 RepID=UPI001CD47D64|nr:hypothetical protein [Hasllibacter sp. MH4015]